MNSIWLSSVCDFLKIFSWIGIFIQSKIFSFFHVIQISPYNFQWDFGFFVFSNHILEYCRILISPSTLMPSRCPEWVQFPTIQILMILFDQFFWILFAYEYFEFKLSTCNSVDEFIICSF